MLLIQFVKSIDISTFPVEIIQSFKHDTYLIDLQLNEYDIINSITSNYDVLSIQSNEDCAYIDVLERHTTSYTTVQAEDTLAPLIEKWTYYAYKTRILCVLVGKWNVITY